ncbi:MAG: FtsX-like permease family protein [Phycisphaerales bacterium]|nr:FtsX-like permease family protein [Phycisphaerales bacterium]
MRLLPFEYAARNLGRSPLRLTLSVGGSVLVVLLVLAAAGFVIGMQASLKVSGDEQNIILLGAGSEESIERSEIPMRTTGIVGASVAGIRTRAGVEAVSPEIHLAMPMLPDGAAEDAISQLAVIRGFEPAAFLVHDDVVITSGRIPMAGHNELAAGQIASIGMGFDPPESILGQSFQLDGEKYEVVGLLAANGGVIEGEFWIPLTDLQITAQRDSLSCVVVRRESATPDDLDAFVAQRLDLELISMEETEYYAALAAFFRPVQWMVIVTAILIALGGVLGGLNTMYAAFASRVREIGSLQTLGYSRLAIMISLVQESILATSVGAIIACGIGWWLLDGLVVRFSMGAFGISITSAVLALGLLSGLFLGIVGAMVPAWRCLVKPIPEALRSGE